MHTLAHNHAFICKNTHVYVLRQGSFSRELLCQDSKLVAFQGKVGRIPQSRRPTRWPSSLELVTSIQVENGKTQ